MLAGMLLGLNAIDFRYWAFNKMSSVFKGLYLTVSAREFSFGLLNKARLDFGTGFLLLSERLVF